MIAILDLNEYSDILCKKSSLRYRRKLYICPLNPIPCYNRLKRRCSLSPRHAIPPNRNPSPGYPLLKRGIFYASRMISGQYGKVFTHSNYGKIRKVYSVWICTRPPRKQEYTINTYSMQETRQIGNHHASKKHYDLIAVIVINLGKKPAEKLTGLFRLLTALFLDRMEAKNLKHILEDEYSIQLTPLLEKGVDTMCNLSEGLVEQGRKQGRKEGAETATIQHLAAIMQKLHITAEEAMDMFDIPAAKRSEYAALL